MNCSIAQRLQWPHKGVPTILCLLILFYFLMWQPVTTKAMQIWPEYKLQPGDEFNWSTYSPTLGAKPS